MGQHERHPRGLYVLFFTEMWERFGFYTIGATLALYLQNEEQGFGWKQEHATLVLAVYQALVYLSPLFGGLLADWKLGFRNAILIGGLIFMTGYFLLTIHSLPMVFVALGCLVTGNGLFKPNVSAMVGHLYPEGSALKDRAYNIFYMGINVGAFCAPLSAALMKKYFGYSAAFAVAGLGMIISVSTLWTFRRYAEGSGVMAATKLAGTSAAPTRAIDAVPNWKRVVALLIIFAIVIVFWMVFHQNSTTLTYWAKENTDWSMTGVVSNDDKDVLGIISNVINPFWVVTLSLPVVGFWHALARHNREPATPTKMALGMALLGLAFLVLCLGARTGEQGLTWEDRYAFRVSIFWLIGAYFIATVGELCLSPMGLSLVSKVAPPHLRGLMMGGWFGATAIGNSLTAIGVYWRVWWHSSFFAILGGMALFMSLVLFLLLKPLKKAMPGV
ncbi:MAG TPA: peptide MFS transporter [Gemmataceae bacterium]|nr:peptide MFS transporter [Gemmataceae bacterium]